MGRKKMKGISRTENPVFDQSIYIDHDGWMFRKMPNWGCGQCGLLTLIQLQDVLRNGVDIGIVRKTTGDERNHHMMGRVRHLRAQIVAAADTELAGYFDPSLKQEAVTNLLKLGHLPTMSTWKEAMSSDSGWLDPQAMIIGAKILGLQGFMLVDTGGKTTTVEKTDKETVKEVGLPLHPLFHPRRVQGYSSLVLYTQGHYEALFKVTNNMCFTTRVILSKSTR